MSLNAKTLAIFFAATAVVASATSMPQPGQCVVDLTNSPYDQTAIRPVACNTEPALVTLAHGASLQILDNDFQQYAGCGYVYTRVQYTDPSTGVSTEGYIGSKYMDCNPFPTEEQLVYRVGRAATVEA